MASSSSTSTHFKRARVSQPWEVFLNFRGEDTRKGFVDHLYEALVREGIQTYKDDETLDRGESIRPALFKAIQESQIAVVVFSENYVGSSWCLDELACIIDCMENKSLNVLPIFYDVDPSDVRKQKRKYAEAFIKHECENKDKVVSWRKALDKAGNLSGLVPKDFANGHEAQCIKKIVATVSSMLSPLHTNVNKDLVGIETRLQDLKSKLKIGSGGVRMVGIWGVGGGGKTTLASAAFMEIHHQFEGCCLLENIREESSKQGLNKLQANMLSRVLKKDVYVGSEIEGKSMIQRKLHHKSVLVVLDDVNERKQLDALAGSHDWFGEGSRIIITTRDEHLLNLKEAMIYEISLFSDDEAMKLFSRHAFKKDEPVEDFKPLSQEVVSYASRLPLALEILGSFLYDKDKDEWKSALAKLKCIPDVEVMERLKISFDGLKHDEKELFLDIACFMRSSKIDEAMTVLDACSFHPRIGVKLLVQKSLIKVSNGRFDMHDLIEEMAHYIVRGKHPNNPEKHSRIWKRKDFVFCAMGVAAPETEVLVLRSNDSYDSENEMKLISEVIPDVMADMKNLRWIDWYGYHSCSIFQSNFQPTKLGCLILRCSAYKQLWEGYKCLPNLKILEIRKSGYLLSTPDFNGLPFLERLILDHCTYLVEIHPSIGYHKRLIFVKLIRCMTLKTFPPIIRMKNLETLDLSTCEQFHKFPDIQMSMDSLINLRLEHTGIELIPPSVGQFCTNLVSFNLNCCFKLKRIEGNFRRLKRLTHLQLSRCYLLEKLACDFFDKECRLEELNLSMIKSYEPTTSVSLKLPQFPRFLRKLNLSRCNLGDGDIPSDMSGFINLQTLNLEGNKFSRLPSLSQIRCLKFLNLSYCQSLIELPDLPSSIAILIAEWCGLVQSVGDLSNYKYLWKVSLWRESGTKLIDNESIVHSMVQVNVVEDRFLSIVLFPRVELSDPCEDIIMTLQLPLPPNWYNEFSGFILCADNGLHWSCRIAIKLEMLSVDSQLDHWEKFDKNPESYRECANVGYIPFASLRHASWWNTSNTHITFGIDGFINPKAGLVPRKSKSKEMAIEYSECWEEDTGSTKTFELTASDSSEIVIVWSR